MSVRNAAYDDARGGAAHTKVQPIESRKAKHSLVRAPKTKTRNATAVEDTKPNGLQLGLENLDGSRALYFRACRSANQESNDFT